MKIVNNQKGESYTIFDPDYGKEKAKLQTFISEFKSNDEEPDKKYGKKNI